MVPRALSLTRCGLSRRTVRPWKAVIFDASNASSIDSTAMQALEEAHEFLQSVDIAFYIANPNRCVHCVPVLLYAPVPSSLSRTLPCAAPSPRSCS